MKDRKNRNQFGDFDSLFNDLSSMFGGFNPINFHGESKTEEGVDENGAWSKQTFMSNDGSVVMTSFYRGGNDKAPGKTTKIDLLKAKLNQAIENEEFERAIILRDEIKKLEENGDKIFDLKNRLAIAIQSQDFEAAIKLRDELKTLE